MVPAVGGWTREAWVPKAHRRRKGSAEREGITACALRQMLNFTQFTARMQYRSTTVLALDLRLGQNLAFLVLLARQALSAFALVCQGHRGQAECPGGPW